MAKSMTSNTTAKKNTNTTVKSVETVSEKKRKEFGASDEISCVSVTMGELIMIGRKTGNLYRWSNYGDSAYVEYQDLKSEKFNAKSRYIYDPLFIIENEDVLALDEFKNVAEVYQHILSASDIDQLFSLDSIAFKKTIIAMPKGIQNSIRSLAVEKIQNGTLDSINKIKAIDEVLGTDLFNAYLGDER